jgi:hypothetical protein
VVVGADHPIERVAEEQLAAELAHETQLDPCYVAVARDHVDAMDARDDPSSHA